MTAPALKFGKTIIYATLLLAVISWGIFTSFPLVESAPTFKVIASGILLRASSTQGYCTTSKNLYFQSMTIVLTGGIIDCSNVKLGSTGYVMPRLGWCSDTATSNLTLTDLTANTLVYSVVGAGTQRIWCPDRGEPTEITGEFSSSWDSVNQVLTTTTSGSGVITLRWYSSTSFGFFEAAQILMGFLPFIILAMVIGAVKYPDYRGTLIKLIVIGGILVLMANLIYAWGL